MVDRVSVIDDALFVQGYDLMMSTGRVTRSVAPKATTGSYVPVSDLSNLATEITAIENAIFPPGSVLMQVREEAEEEEVLGLREVSDPGTEEDLISKEEFDALAEHVNEITGLLSQEGQELFVVNAR